jgi:phospholipid/cholesterol/gamma-HCH transport system substrate-binding protein
MTRGIKIRLVAFLMLSAVGIVYVAASYLGIVDKVTGRGLTLHADLPSSGGLFTGSEVTYRGVKVGQVSGMDVTPSGVRLTLSVKEGTRIPKDSPVYVHNLSAVGEQYLDFEPKSKAGPYAVDGTAFHGGQASLPEPTDDLLLKINGLVGSLNRNDVSTVVSELGTMFNGTADPLRRMVDSGTKLVTEAKANQAATIDLLDSGETVLHTQQANAGNIASFTSNLADLTGTLKDADVDLRTLLQGGAPAVREVNGLLQGLSPTLPVLMSNLVTVNQVITARLQAVEQTLVIFPAVISSGFTGTPGDGYGHINLQFNNTVPACTKGYKPPSQWRPGTDLTDTPIYPAQCLSGPPYDMRGTKYAPAPVGPVSANSGSANRVAPYDARTGQVNEDLTIGRHTVFGDNSWQWMLLGPTETR